MPDNAAGERGTLARIEQLDAKGNPPRDGLWAVVTDTWVAGFVVRDGRVVDCAPILRRRLGYWMTRARWVGP